SPCLVSCNNHSTFDFNSGLVKTGSIGNGTESICYSCELHSYLEVVEVDYEAGVQCQTFCDASFLSAIYIAADMDTKNNVQATRLTRCVAQSIIGDSDFFPEQCAEESIVSSCGCVDDFNDSCF
ncbi:MAG: acetylornithine aminotransferase, partial [Okeania sp. SIO2D1]|nr:acetylornithine aminotransferase [Okeania sp. SIO2D1]